MTKNIPCNIKLTLILLQVAMSVMLKAPDKVEVVWFTCCFYVVWKSKETGFWTGRLD